MTLEENLKTCLMFLDEFQSLHTRNYEAACKKYNADGTSFPPENVIYGLSHDLALGVTNVCKGIVPQAIEAGVEGNMNDLVGTEQMLDLVTATAADCLRRLSTAVDDAYCRHMYKEGEVDKDAIRKLIWHNYNLAISELRKSVFEQSLKAALQSAPGKLSS